MNKNTYKKLVENIETAYDMFKVLNYTQMAFLFNISLWGVNYNNDELKQRLTDRLDDSIERKRGKSNDNK